MTKDQCVAIIRAIEETTNFIMTNGITIRNSISDPVSDAQDYGCEDMWIAYVDEDGNLQFEEGESA